MQGVRNLRLGLVLRQRDGTSPFDIGPLCRLGLPGVSEGLVMGIPMTPDQMLADQERALVRLERAARLCMEADPELGAIGLGSLCAVVAGRGEALAERLPLPVTTGGAATAWALFENTKTVVAAVGGPVGLVGASGAVGGAVAALLAAEGIPVRLDHSRAARGLKGPVEAFDGPAAAVAGCPVIVGAGPTGATLEAAAVRPGAVIVDVALPGTVRGPLPTGARLLAGEAVRTPPAWTRDGWGLIYQVLAGYGPSQVFACLVEPLILAAAGRATPYALGRKISLDAVSDLGERAATLGFVPQLSHGLRAFPAHRLPRALPG